MLDTPETNGRDDYTVQINLSWPHNSSADDVPATDAEKLENMRRRAKDLHPTLRRAVELIPDGIEVVEVGLKDWPCLEWDNFACVTLIGDAAHAMTMCMLLFLFLLINLRHLIRKDRGEAMNHGIVDVGDLMDQLTLWKQRKKTMKEALDTYEDTMRGRASSAVLLSRQACLDAHNFPAIKEGSPLLAKRAQSGKVNK